MVIKAGHQVPEISVLDQNSQPVRLSDFKGQNIVLYFYPKDNTPGCTMEAKDFRDNLKQFGELNTVILGVSRDNEIKHKKFIDKYCLPFDLLADIDGKLCQEFGAWVEKSMFGKKYMGIERCTFLIDPTGVVLAEWRNVKVRGHAKDILEVIKKIKVKE